MKRQLANGTISNHGMAFYALWALTELNHALDGLQYRSLIARHSGQPVAYLALLRGPSFMHGREPLDHREGQWAQVDKAREWRDGELKDTPHSRQFRADVRYLRRLLEGIEKYPHPQIRREGQETIITPEYEDYDLGLVKLTALFEGSPPHVADALISAYPGKNSTATAAILFGMGQYLRELQRHRKALSAEVVQQKKRLMMLIERDLRAGEDRGEFLMLTQTLHAFGSSAQNKLALRLRRARFGRTGWERWRPARRSRK